MLTISASFTPLIKQCYSCHSDHVDMQLRASPNFGNSFLTNALLVKKNTNTNYVCVQ